MEAVTFAFKRDKSGITSGDFDSEFLLAHNRYRKWHGVPPLMIDDNMNKEATQWAKHLSWRNTLKHRGGDHFGENLLCIACENKNFKITADEVVNEWYKEITSHYFGIEPRNLRSTHFTQIIWKSSRGLGVGVSKSWRGLIYVVAIYQPPGNIRGQFVENCPPVLPQFQKCLLEFVGDTGRQSTATIKSSIVAIDRLGFAEEILDSHNEFRSIHDSPPLNINYEISTFAQEWADHCSESASLQHRMNNKYGENIYSAYSSDYTMVPSPREVVKEWYDEIEKHNFKKPDKIVKGSLHFTQLVWKSTTELGVGIAKNKKGQTYVVCNYSPKGNIGNKFAENVLPPKK